MYMNFHLIFARCDRLSYPSDHRDPDKELNDAQKSDEHLLSVLSASQSWERVDASGGEAFDADELKRNERHKSATVVST